MQSALINKSTDKTKTKLSMPMLYFSLACSVIMTADLIIKDGKATPESWRKPAEMGAYIFAGFTFLACCYTVGPLVDTSHTNIGKTKRKNTPTRIKNKAIHKLSFLQNNDSRSQTDLKNNGSEYNSIA